MVRCWYCPGCNEWGQRFQYGCRKCKRGQFKHRKCGNWVTAQYGFCPICYKGRLERKPKIKKLSKPQDTMPKGYGQDTSMYSQLNQQCQKDGSQKNDKDIFC